MNENTEPPKKCFCARCFLPVTDEDKVDIEGQNFHRICSMCCVCRTIPTSLKMFYGHMFCADCFNNHVLTRFKGEGSRVHSNSWWMQWAPGSRPESSQEEKSQTPKSETPSQDDAPRRGCICTRCLQQVEERDRVTIGDQAFHSQCAKCYFCQDVPSTCPKIYYGQVFCEDCFHKHVLTANKDNPNEFFRHCFDQWQYNQQFSSNMRDFMGSSSSPAPFIFMMQGQQPPFCRCGTEPQQEWLQNNEPKKSATPVTCSSTTSFGNLTFENPTDAEQADSEKFEDSTVAAAAAQKIEKLTKYLNERDLTSTGLKWQNFIQSDKFSLLSEPCSGWVNLQDSHITRLGLNCPMCLWQCGFIYVK